jgi:hypothetical protein
MDDATYGSRRGVPAPLPGLGGEALPGAAEWINTVRKAVQTRSPQAPVLAEAALRACPRDPDLLLLGRRVTDGGYTGSGAGAAQALPAHIRDRRSGGIALRSRASPTGS